LTSNSPAQQWRSKLLLLSPLLAAFLIMLPRLLSVQFGLLDDGVMLGNARAIGQDWTAVFRATSGTGRFFPAYWLYYFAIYAIGGTNPLVFFVTNYAAFAVITAGLIYYVRYRGGSRLQAWTAGMFFVLAGPAVESFYTLSKGEVSQTIWLFAALLLITRLTPTVSRWKKIAIVVLSSVTLLLADLSKETSLVIIPISLGWVIVGMLSGSAAGDKMDLASRKVFCLASWIAGGAFFALRAAFTTTSILQGSYTEAYRLDWSRFLISSSRWSSYLIRDFPYLLPLAIFVLAAYALKKQTQGHLLLDAVVWMLGWIAILLPWQSLLEYYLLPFTLGVAIFSGVVVGQAVTWMSAASTKQMRILASFCLITCFGMVPFLLANNATNAQYQLAADRVNSELVSFLATLPTDSKVLVNIPNNSEYVYELGLHLSDIQHRPDIKIGHFESQVPTAATGNLSYYVVTPLIENQLLPSVRLGADESSAQQWEQYLRNFLGDRLVLANVASSTPALVLNDQTLPIHQIEYHFQQLDFGLHRLICLVVLPGQGEGLFCDTPRSFIDNRQFLFGWKVYNVTSNMGMNAQPGTFHQDGSWELQLANGKIKRLHMGESGDIPLIGDWDGDGFTEIGVFRPANLTWYLDKDIDGTPDIEFQFAGMTASDIPIVGDWDGNGTTTAGYFRPTDVSWHFRNSNTSGPEDKIIHQFGLSTDKPIAGDWDGKGRDTIGFYRPATGLVNLLDSLTEQPILRYFSIPPESISVVADWGGRGFDTIAIVTGTQWQPRYTNCNCYPSNPLPTFEFDTEQGVPVAGKWKVQP
jgi:hypothetical protein